VSGEDTAKVARDAAIQSLIANGVYLLLLVGISVMVTRRDWLARQALRARHVMSANRRQVREARLLADFRRDISRYEHEGPGG
jgi:hypothetical protein